MTELPHPYPSNADGAAENIDALNKMDQLLEHPVHEHVSFLRQEIKEREKAIHKGLQDWLKSARDEYPKHEEAWWCLDIMLDEARDAYYEGKFPWEMEDDDE